MKSDNLLTDLLDEATDSIDDSGAKYQFVKELNSYTSKKLNQLQSQIHTHQKNVTRENVKNVTRQKVNNANHNIFVVFLKQP